MKQGVFWFRVFPLLVLLWVSFVSSVRAITVNEYAIPTPNSGPFQIIAGPDGNCWFSEANESRIGRITTNGAISEFPLPNPRESPYSLIAGSDALSYLVAGRKIGKVAPNGAITEFPLPVPASNAIPEITTDAEGNIRFVQLRSQPPPAAAEYFLGKLTPSGTYSETPLGQFGLYYITDLGLGPDGILWISTFGAPDESGLSREVYNGFRRLNPDGTLSATFIPTQSLAPTNFIARPDGGFWFLATIGADSNRLGKATLDGAVIHYETGGVTLFTDFANGPGGNLWLIDPSRNLVGKLTPDGLNSIVTTRAASYVSGALAADSIATLFGNALAPATASASALPLPTTLAGVSVKVRDSNGTEQAASLFYVSPSQINLLIPLGAATGNATITVIGSNGQTINTGTLIIDTVAPGLFAAAATGRGPAAALAQRVKADGSQSYEPVARFDPAQNKYVTVPIDLGPESDQVFLVLFGSGVRGNSDLGKVSAHCSGGALPVEYAGAQGGFVGLDQINLRLPRTLTIRGEQDVVLTVAGRALNRVRINIRAN